MVSKEELLSDRNMRIFNLIAIALVVVAWLVRFYYMKERDEIVEKEVTDDAGVTTVEFVEETH